MDSCGHSGGHAEGTPLRKRDRSWIDLELGPVEVDRAAADASGRPNSEAVGLRGSTMEAMSSSDASSEWDLTVPGDDAELVAEFRRHGVRPGQRVHVALVADEAEADHGSSDALPSFFASFEGPTDLAERSGEILRAEFPNVR